MTNLTILSEDSIYVSWDPPGIFYKRIDNYLVKWGDIRTDSYNHDKLLDGTATEVNTLEIISCYSQCVQIDFLFYLDINNILMPMEHSFLFCFVLQHNSSSEAKTKVFHPAIMQEYDNKTKLLVARCDMMSWTVMMSHS